MSLTKKMLPGLLMAATLGASTSVLAGASGNIAASSDYIWRGASQTASQSAVSGGLDYGHDVGVYAGTWVSPVAGDTEIDVYAGFSKEFGGVGIDLGYLIYHYVAGADAAEMYFGLSYSMLGATYYYDADNENAWLEASADYEVKKDLSLGVNFGMSMMKDTAADYMTYGATITKTVGDWSASFTASATDVEDSEPTAFVSISREFDL